MYISDSSKDIYMYVYIYAYTYICTYIYVWSWHHLSLGGLKGIESHFQGTGRHWEATFEAWEVLGDHLRSRTRWEAL